MHICIIGAILLYNNGFASCHYECHSIVLSYHSISCQLQPDLTRVWIYDHTQCNACMHTIIIPQEGILIGEHCLLLTVLEKRKTKKV